MLYYIGTVILHMTPIQFWHSTPRKLSALCEVHARVNDPKSSKKNKNVPELPNNRPVGPPDTFIDKL